MFYRVIGYTKVVSLAKKFTTLFGIKVRIHWRSDTHCGHIVADGWYPSGYPISIIWANEERGYAVERFETFHEPRLKTSLMVYDKA